VTLVQVLIAISSRTLANSTALKEVAVTTCEEVVSDVRVAFGLIGQVAQSNFLDVLHAVSVRGGGERLAKIMNLDALRGGL
jgi:hypothetical protein